jgi:hypothetical protein
MRKYFILINLIIILTLPNFVSAENIALASKGGKPFVGGVYQWPQYWMGGAECLNDNYISYYDGWMCQWLSQYNHNYKNTNTPVTHAIFGVEFPLIEVNKIVIYQTRRHLDRFRIEYKNSANQWITITTEQLPLNTNSPTPNSYREEFVFESVQAKGIRIVPLNTPYDYIRISELQVYSTPLGIDLSGSVNIEPDVDIKTGDVITIKGSVANSGNKESGAFTIRYYIDGVEQTSWAETIDSLDKSKQIDLPDKQWTATVGNHEIKIKIDTDNNIGETDENNNEATKSFTVRDCVNEYWYSSMDRNCDGEAGLIEWNEAHNSNSYETNNIKQNVKTEWENVETLFNRLRGKTLVWDVTVQSDDGPVTTPVHLQGSYTFPDVDFPGYTDPSGHPNHQDLYFRVNDKYQILVSNDFIRIKYGTTASTYGLGDCTFCSTWDGNSWNNQKHHYFGGHQRPYSEVEFGFYPNALKKSTKTYNWGFSYVHLPESGDWSQWYTIRDTSDSPNKGKILDGSYIKITNAQSYDFIPEITLPDKLCEGFVTFFDITSKNLRRIDLPEYNIYYDNNLYPADSGTISFSNQKSNGIMLTPGTHTLRLVLDPDNKIQETNEENNIKEITFTTEDCSDIKSQLVAKFQIRTAPNNNGQPGTWTDWLGPGCSTDTYYTNSGQPIECNLHKGNKYIQFRAFIDESPQAYPLINKVKISYSGKFNLNPIVSLKIEPPELFLGKNNKATLTANAVDRDGTIVSYKWDFGDGSPQQTTTENTVKHKYNKAGIYKASVTVLDDSGGKTTTNNSVYVSSYDCLKGDNKIKTKNMHISSIDSIRNPNDLSQSSEEVKAELISWILDEYAESKGISPREVDTTIEYYEAVAKFINKHMGYVLRPKCEGYESIVISAKDIFEAGMDNDNLAKCNPWCANDFCGQCIHYSYFFTALTRLLGVSEKCVYTATSQNHAYNIINYLGKFRIHEPQSERIGLQFNSKALNWIACGPDFYDSKGDYKPCIYGGHTTDFEWPHYAPWFVFNDAYGDRHNGQYPRYPSNAHIYTMNYIDSSGMPDPDNVCPENFVVSNPDSNNVNDWQDWIEQGVLTYFKDKCP